MKTVTIMGFRRALGGPLHSMEKRSRLILGIRQVSTASDKPPKKKKRVVIIGSGWAGYTLARTLSPANSTRILISPRSHFVFTPLLASASVGTIEPRASIEPVRRLGLDNFHQGWASGVNFKRKTVLVEAAPPDDAAGNLSQPVGNGTTFEVEYDQLVLAVGCHSQTFGIEGVEEYACFLRDVGDARKLRQRILRAFEKASMQTTPECDRRKLLHFAIVGGGPTGIEFAGELNDLLRKDLAKMYPELLPYAKITIYDISSKVLPMFGESLTNYAVDRLRQQGIEVKTGHSLKSIRRSGEFLSLKIDQETEDVGAGVVLWSTGLRQNPLVEELVQQKLEGNGNISKDTGTGGIVVDSHFRVRIDNGSILPNVFAIGDCAVMENQRLPATAQVANQQAAHLGRYLNNPKPDMRPFKFRDLGAMAYLGGSRAIHQNSKGELKGIAAWLLWRAAYLVKSFSIRNRLLIPVYWAATWITGRDISRF
ncbi:unnamed protein product [Clonostachys rosea f. rosea IK726]|uniref:Uncharacterized protein n=2 Tax=Bionectria ochroleuca TaxID=29856 RepID=A0A0B7KKU7_BIOOC|nr:unnamed protein product [Clonostachys rosea f. rosea IK726]